MNQSQDGDAAEVDDPHAAAMLGMTRDQVRALLAAGRLERGSTRQDTVTVASIRAFRDAEQARARSAMADLAAQQNALGLVD